MKHEQKANEYYIIAIRLNLKKDEDIKIKEIVDNWKKHHEHISYIKQAILNFYNIPQSNHTKDYSDIDLGKKLNQLDDTISRKLEIINDLDNKLDTMKNEILNRLNNMTTTTVANEIAIDNDTNKKEVMLDPTQELVENNLKKTRKEIENDIMLKNASSSILNLFGGLDDD